MIMWDRKELKMRGKAAFKANYWRCVLVGILLVMFVAGTAVSTSGTASSGMDEVNSGNEITSQTQTAISEEEVYNEVYNEVQQDPEFQRVLRVMIAKIGILLFTVLLICICLRLFVFNLIEVGCRGFFVRNSEGPASVNEVKAGFFPYGRNVKAMFLRDLFIVLWDMLFVIPGLIKRYSYKMVPYILADDPSIGALDAISLSRKMMNGHKWKAFVLDLSFIGWDLLAMLTLGLVGVFYANPYQFCTGAELYRVLKNQ